MPEEKTYLLVEDLRRIFGEEVAKMRGLHRLNVKPVSERTVWAYARPTGRYTENPMPQPKRVLGRLMWFPEEGETIADLELRLRRWWSSRQGAGRPKADP